MKKKIAALMASLGMGVQAETIDPQKYIAQSYAGLQEVTQVHSQTWGLGQEVNWGVDQNTGLITFLFEDGKKAEAPVQIIGTYSPADGSFMWGWDHPSVDPALGEAAALLKQFGEEHQISKLTSQPVDLSEQEAWEFTALAMRLADNNGAYRADAGGGTLVYMTFGKISLSQTP